LSIDPLLIIPSTRAYQKLCRNKRYVFKKNDKRRRRRRRPNDDKTLSK
jgi:hypothetical protein